MLTGSTNNPISQIFLMLAAPIYWCKIVSSTMHWCVIKALKILAAHCLFGRPLPVQSAVASGKGNRFYTRWQQN